MKRLINILFDEVEEEVDLDTEYEEEEELIIPTTTTTVELPKQRETVTIKSETVVHTPVFEAENDRIHISEKTSETKSTMIDIDTIIKAPSTPSYAQTVRKNTEYEFTQVISPMFGLKGEYDENEEYIVSTPLKRKTHNSSLLGTVISPIYGIAKEDTPTVKAFTHVNDEEYVENYSLDDLIKAPVTFNEKDAWDELQEPIVEEDLESLVKTFEEIEEIEAKTIIEGSRLNLFDDEK